MGNFVLDFQNFVLACRQVKSFLLRYLRPLFRAATWTDAALSLRRIFKLSSASVLRCSLHIDFLVHASMRFVRPGMPPTLFHFARSRRRAVRPRVENVTARVLLPMENLKNGPAYCGTFQVGYTVCLRQDDHTNAASNIFSLPLSFSSPPLSFSF